MYIPFGVVINWPKPGAAMMTAAVMGPDDIVNTLVILLYYCNVWISRRVIFPQHDDNIYDTSYIRLVDIFMNASEDLYLRPTGPRHRDREIVKSRT